MREKLTSYEHHRLDQCEATIQEGKKVIESVSEEEYRQLMEKLNECRPNDYSWLKEMFDAWRASR